MNDPQPTAKSETPRTDAELHWTTFEDGWHSVDKCNIPEKIKVAKWVPADFARQLERELNQWQEAAMELGDCLSEVHGTGTANPEPPCKTCSALAKLSTLTNQKEHDEKC